MSEPTYRTPDVASLTEEVEHLRTTNETLRAMLDKLQKAPEEAPKDRRLSGYGLLGMVVFIMTLPFCLVFAPWFVEHKKARVTRVLRSVAGALALLTLWAASMQLCFHDSLLRAWGVALAWFIAALIFGAALFIIKIVDRQASWNLAKTQEEFEKYHDFKPLKHPLVSFDLKHLPEDERE